MTNFSCLQVMLTIMTMWGVCGILTLTEHLPEKHPARTDFKLKIIEDSPWFRIPYPGK
jgi:nucleobase transporter 1/2